MYASRRTKSAYTLVEVLLVVVLLAAISAMALPNFLRDLEREQLPGSARRLRSLIALTRANAAFDGKRYRIRFPTKDDEDPLLGRRQPMVEREDDPINEPDVFNQVTAPWAIQKTFLRDIRCIEVRPGRPTIAALQELRKLREDIKRSLEQQNKRDQQFDPMFPPLYIEPDGSSDWATFVLTDAPDDIAVEELDRMGETGQYHRIDVIADGMTGLTWLQRPFYDEELDLFEQKGWPAVMRQDFLDPRALTENDVLELHKVEGRRRTVEDPNADAQPQSGAAEANVPQTGDGP